MLKILGSFLFGVYIGQEYGRMIPSVKIITKELYEDFCNTELYKSLDEKYNKKNKKE